MKTDEDIFGAAICVRGLKNQNAKYALTDILAYCTEPGRGHSIDELRQFFRSSQLDVPPSKKLEGLTFLFEAGFLKRDGENFEFTEIYYCALQNSHAEQVTASAEAACR